MRTFFAYLLYPITILYSIGVYLRNLFYDLGWRKSIKHNVTTIGVGNLKVGGTGKTPHVEYLIEVFSDIYKVGVLSRGYGRKTKGLRIIDLEKDNALSVGDEPLQMKQKYPNIVFAVCEDRNKAIEEMIKQHKDLELIILDDSFQHRSLSVDLSILLTEYSKPFFKDRILPFGLLREQKKGYKRADYIIITKSHQNYTLGDKVSFESQIKPKKYQKVFFSNIDYKPLYSLLSGQVIDDFSNYSIILLTAIADNTQMVEYISGKSSILEKIEFPDHYNFHDKDIDNMLGVYNSSKQDNTIIITTEKDATRLKAFERLKDLPIFVLPIGLTITSSVMKSTNFKEIIIDDVQQNKSYSRLYQ
ncbi:MAG: tetraacyldisaccharide 4'-kinase [Bacteroidales bacterium]|nr:tetraacyldisaccharide 4'-kinase [Bacteroidales bacterium]